MLINPSLSYADLFHRGHYKEIIYQLDRKIHRSAFEDVVLCYCYSKIGDDLTSQQLLPGKFSLVDFDSSDEFVISNLMNLEVLLQLGQYIDFVRYNKNLHPVIQQVDDEDYSTYLQLKLDVLECEYFISRAFEDRAIHRLNELLPTVSEKKHPQIIAQICHSLGFAYRKKAKYDLALQNYNRAMKIRTGLSNPNDLAFTINHIGIVYIQINQFEKAIDYFNEILDMEGKLQNDQIKAKILNNFGIIYQMKGDLETSMDYFLKSVRLSESINNFSNMGTCYINLGNVKQQRSKFSEALNYYRKAEAIYINLNDDTSYTMVMFSIGRVHKKLGNFKQAEFYYERALVIARRLQDEAKIAIILNNLANLHSSQGKVTESIDEFQEVLKLTKKLDDIQTEAHTLTNIAQSYFKQGQYDDAIDAFVRSYNLKKELGNLIEISITLFHLIQTEIAYENEKSAKKYLKEFKKLSSRTDNLEVKSLYNIARANLLQQSEDVSDQITASQLIEEVMSGEYVNFEINIFAMISFCEYLIMELRVTNSMEVLETLESTLTRLYRLASENESHELIAKTLIIQAKLALLTYDTKEAINYLHQALAIAENHHLEELVLKISYIETQVQSSLYNMTDELYAMSSEQPSFDQRIDELEIMEYVKNLYYQKQSYEILRADLSNIRKFNSELAKLIQYNERVPLSLENLARIVELTSREINVIYRSLLLLNEIEEAKYLRQIENMNIKLIFEDIINIYQPGFDQKALDLRFHIDPSAMYANIDRELFEKILDHLMINIIKFTPQGGSVNIEVGREHGLVMTFQNSCETLPQDILQKLPEKYFQYSSNKRLVKGYGIGLTFVELAADLMRMSVDLVSPIPGQDQGFQIRIHM